MARLSINPLAGGNTSIGTKKSSYDAEGLALDAGLNPVDFEPKKSGFSHLMDLLNAPSRFVEKEFTGGSSYDKRLDEMGIQNTKGQIDLNDILSNTGRMLADPLNVLTPLKVAKLVGKVPGVTKGLKATGSAIKKLPVVNKTIEATQEAFVPMAKLKRKSSQLAEELTALETSTRAKQIHAVREVAKLGKGFSPGIRKNIGKIVEKAGQGKRLTNEEKSALTKAREFIEQTITNPERKAGIKVNILADYFPRKAERDAVEKLLLFGGNRLSKNLGGAEKLRTYKTQIKGELAGIKYKNPIEALAIRASKSESARASLKFIKHLVGGGVKDNDGISLIAPIRKGLIDDGHEAFTINSLKGYQAPTEAVREIEKYYKTFISDDATNQLLKYYDSALGVWKGSVTSLFPAFHIRNAIGNLTNMWFGGFKNPLLLATAGKIQNGKKIVIKGTEVSKEKLEELGITRTGQFGADIQKTLADEIGHEFGHSNPLKKFNIFEPGRKAGEIIENNAKTAFFIDRLNKGDTIPQAVAQVKKYLFDYSALTPFEKGFMKRINPFYTWTRNNVPLQIETLIRQPGKQAAITKAFSNLTPLTEDEKEALPEYLTEGLSGSLGKTPGGDLNVLSGLGLPIEDLGRFDRGSPERTLERETVGAAGPLGSALGMIINRDFFRGQPIDELTQTYGYTAKKYPDWAKKLVDYNETADGTSVVNPYKFALLQLFGSRVFNTVAEPIKAVQFAKIKPVDLKASKGRQEYKKEQKINKALEQKGELKKFQRYYVPKSEAEKTGKTSKKKGRISINPL